MKIKVNKAKLIAAIQAKAKLAQDSYKKELSEWEKRCNDTTKKLVRDLTEFLDNIKAGKFDPNQGPSYRTWPSWPYKPSQPRTAADIEGLLARLTLVEGEVIDIDDKSDYFDYI